MRDAGPNGDGCGALFCWALYGCGGARGIGGGIGGGAMVGCGRGAVASGDASKCVGRSGADGAGSVGSSARGTGCGVG